MVKREKGGAISSISTANEQIEKKLIGNFYICYLTRRKET